MAIKNPTLKNTIFKHTILMNIKSSNVFYLEYNSSTHELIAELKTGKYSYKDVALDDFLKLKEAYINKSSVGTVFNQLIVKGGYKYEKL